jgi:formylglycine-generating enzyme required for sulfatase activity
MNRIEGGKFLMGSNSNAIFKEDGEGPVREIEIGSFYLAETTVTNTEFATFVRNTRYKTDAEKFGWSFVFHMFIQPSKSNTQLQSPQGTPWWKKVEGSSWRHPNDPRSNIKSIMNHPVVHISWNDAIEYCNWAGLRLPSESEWEYAARGGLQQSEFPWGNDLTPDGKHMCNIWQGEFPIHNTQEDGFAATCPANIYKPNEFGLYNVVGNVWEWQNDWFSTDFHRYGTRKNPIGPGSGTSKTIKDGSYLCHDSYCNRYRVSARSANTPDSSTGNLGFRCASDI